MADPSEICQSSKSLKIPQRWVTIFLGFLGLFSSFCMRACLSIAITEMTLSPNQTAKVNSDDTRNDNYNRNITQLRVVQHSKAEKYEWSEHTQGLILASFYLGYACSCALCGVICQKIGGKQTLNLGILIASVSSLLTPYCIKLGGAIALIFLRIVMGFGEGTTYPAIIHLMAYWIPENERSRAGAIAFSGPPFGTIFGMIVSGIILEHSDIGWPLVFYLSGIIGVIWLLLNSAFCYNRPSENPYISEEELTYLKNRIKNKHINIAPTPWQFILKSPVVWALITAKVSFTWGYLTIISDMPKYMSNILKFSAQANGYLSSIPHLSAWIGNITTCWIADKIITKGFFSITNVRKIGCTISSLGPAIFLIAASYAGCNSFAVITLQSIGLALMGCTSFSVQINPLDLSPNYASSITGLGNGIASVCGMLAPYIVGVLTPNQTINEWRLVFWIIFAIYMLSNIVYLIYGSGKVQKWNDPAFLNKKNIASTDKLKEDGVLLTLNEL